MKNVKIVEINLAKYKDLLYTENKKEKIDYILGSFKSKDIIYLNNILKKCVSKKKRELIVKEVMLIMSNIKIRFTKKEMAALDKMVMDGYLEELEEKKAEGLKQGEKLGIKNGKKQKAQEIAKNLLAEKISVDVIKKVTGLPMKTIKSLML